MSTVLRFVVVTLGIAALVRWLRRRSETPGPAPAAPLEDPADELRRKLAESRAVHEEPVPAASSSSVEERRAEVHAQGRAALSEMTSADDES